MKWKTGDWCFFEFKLCQIQEVEKGRVTSVSDGSFNTGGWSLEERCVPLTLRNANLSGCAEYWSSRLHREGNNALNYPDIHRKLVDLWLECCMATEPNLKIAVEKMDGFPQKILDIVKDSERQVVDGVPLLRRGGSRC